MRDRAPVRNDCAYEAAKEFCVALKNDISVIKTPAAGMPDARGIIKCNCYTGEGEKGGEETMHVRVSAK